MSANPHEAIARRAYEIWESEGHPHGRDREHWEQAAFELGDVTPMPENFHSSDPVASEEAAPADEPAPADEAVPADEPAPKKAPARRRKPAAEAAPAEGTEAPAKPVRKRRTTTAPVA